MPSVTASRVGVLALLVLTVLLAPAAGLAAGAPAPDDPALQSPYPPSIACRCRANGRSYALGERACLDTPAGPRQARCRMVQNVTSWAIEEEGCVAAGLAPGGTAGR